MVGTPFSPLVHWSLSRNAPDYLADNCQLVADARVKQLQQFWRQDLCRRRTSSLEQSAAQCQTMEAVIRPVQAVTGEIFIRTVRPRRSFLLLLVCVSFTIITAQCELFSTAPNRNILTYLLSYSSLYHVYYQGPVYRLLLCGRNVQDT